MKHLFLHFWDNKWALSITAGIFLGLSYPPFPFPFFVPVAFILLFRIIECCPTARSAAFYTWPAFLIWNVIVTYWLMMATLIGGILAILGNSALMTLPILFIHLFKRRIRGTFSGALMAASTWTAYEYLIYRWDLAWPWLSLGNAFAMTPRFVEFIAWTGTIGVTFWIVYISYLAFRFLATGHKKTGIAALVIIILPIIFSLIWYSHIPTRSNRSVQVVVVQPNYNSYLEMSGYPNPYIPLQEILHQSDSLRTDSTRLILWPENAIQTGIDASSPITQILRDSSRAWNTTIITGTAFFHFYKPDKAPELVHTTATGRPYNVYNAAAAFYPDGTLHLYRKAKLVPIVERVPFVEVLSRIIPFGIDWGNLQGFGRGKKATVFRIAPHAKVSTAICYDSVFPNWNRHFVGNGANLISVITNDGWWGYTSGYFQHFEYARLLAIEMHRYVIRSANNGVSTIIAPDGRVLKRTQFWTRTAFRDDVPLFSDQTFYVRHGDWPGLLSLIIFLAGLFVLILTRQRRKNRFTATESTQ